MRSLPDRFWAKVDKSGECWRWTSAIANGTGYGQFHYRGKTRLAHRLVYLEAIGPIPDGMELDHLCRNRWCVNPAHLQAVTHSENVRRGLSVPPLSVINRAKIVCKRGHPLAGENVRIYRGRRHCRICLREGQRIRRATP
jgi:hypothetical protein